jgi:hypothetical protein
MRIKPSVFHPKSVCLTKFGPEAGETADFRPVMTRARTPMAAALQRPATRIGALGEGRPPIGIGSTDLALAVRGVRRPSPPD